MWHFGRSENHLSTGETKQTCPKNRGHRFGFEGLNKIYLPPNSAPSGLAQVPDVTSSCWVTLLPWFSKCGPHKAALAPPGTC